MCGEGIREAEEFCVPFPVYLMAEPWVGVPLCFEEKLRHREVSMNVGYKAA